MREDQQPSNKEIRDLIKDAEIEYNSEWQIDRDEYRIRNSGHIGVGTSSPLPNRMKQFKDKDGNILDHRLADALKEVTRTLTERLQGFL